MVTVDMCAGVVTVDMCVGVVTVDMCAGVVTVDMCVGAVTVDMCAGVVTVDIGGSLGGAADVRNCTRPGPAGQRAVGLGGQSDMG